MNYEMPPGAGGSGTSQQQQQQMYPTAIHQQQQKIHMMHAQKFQELKQMRHSDPQQFQNRNMQYQATQMGNPRGPQVWPNRPGMGPGPPQTQQQPQQVPTTQQQRQLMRGCLPHQQGMSTQMQPMQQNMHMMQQQQFPSSSAVQSVQNRGASNFPHPHPSPLQQQPASVQPETPQKGPLSIPTPFSNQGPGSNQTMETEKSAEYIAKLNELKEKFLDRLLMIDERSTRDGTPKPKGFNILIEVLLEKRIIPFDNLVKLPPSLIVLIQRDCVTYPLMDELKKMLDKDDRTRVQQQNDKATEEAKPFELRSEVYTCSSEIRLTDFPNIEEGVKVTRKLVDKHEKEECNLADTWKNVRHLAIKVPDHVRQIVEEDMETRSRSSSVADCKRKISDVRTEEDVARKRIRTEDYQVSCVFDNRKPWSIPPAAQQELSRVLWTVDHQSMPTSSSSPQIVVCVSSQLVICAPLRIAIPLNYPEAAATVLFDRSFPCNVPAAAQMEKLYEKWIGTRQSARTITDLCEAFDKTCQEFLCIQQSSQHRFNGLHGTNKSKIAHKGMVA